MITGKPGRTDLLGDDVQTPVVWIAAVVILAVWVGAHFLCRRLAMPRPVQLGAFAARVAAGTVALWTFWQALARHLVLETTWSLWLCGFIGGLAIEIVVTLYQWEKRVVSARLGRWLLGLRLVLTAAVLAMLVQPVFAWNETRRIDRNVIVLVDDSASMQIADKDMPVAEKLAVAAFEGIDILSQRPVVTKLFSEAKMLAADFEKMAAVFDLPDSATPEEMREFTAGRKQALDKLKQDGDQWSHGINRALENDPPGPGSLPQDIKKLRSELRRRYAGELQDALDNFKRGYDDKDVRRLRAGARDAAAQLLQMTEFAGPYIDAVDTMFYSALPAESRHAIDAAAARTRAEIGQRLLTRKKDSGPSLLERIGEKYTLRFMRFGKKAAESDRPDGPEGDETFRSRTDLTGALRRIRELHPAESLAAVVAVSDFRHNGTSPPDDEARALGLQGSPVCPLLTGSTRGTKDAAIVSLGSPQSIFLGDRIRVKADLKADGLRGRELSVKLLQEGAVVYEEKVAIPDNNYRPTLRLSHQPADKGIHSYTVKIDPVEGEIFPNNNEWSFDTAVSDDRTNVLIVDDRPRWEFRYLRNLFDSRDKSVHLQYVLLHPDTLEGAPPPPDLAASASRKFGESEATRLPATAEEWRKFDVIILGDVPPAVMGGDTWDTIRDCVEQRGAMLVIVAGPAHMPHAFTNAAAQNLIPVMYEPGTRELIEGPEPAYRLTLTAGGRGSPIFAQAESGLENTRIWNEIPVLRWRHAVTGIRKGAEVLAWARQVPVDALGNPVEEQTGAPLFTGDPASALRKQKETEEKNALIVVSQTGLGKVAMLNFDQTWRFRYGVGDTVHHRFWGQLMRWGAGENLAAGTTFVRLGTRKLSYEPGEKVRVMARLIDESFRPVAGADAGIAIYREDQLVAKKTLTYQAASHGMYETEIDSLTEPGTYRVELTGAKVEELLAKENVKTVDQKLTITADGNPVELGEISVDPELAAQVASLSGGVVAGPDETDRLLSLFGPASRDVEERREKSLWDNWILLAVAVSAATAEWILRRRGGLV